MAPADSKRSEFGQLARPTVFPLVPAFGHCVGPAQSLEFLYVEGGYQRTAHERYLPQAISLAIKDRSMRGTRVPEVDIHQNLPLRREVQVLALISIRA